jgi:uncharacterized protein YukJ
MLLVSTGRTRCGVDKYFKEIKPSTGIHDIHMNQGNKPGKYFKDNGIYQDGGCFFIMSPVNAGL